MGDRTDPTDMTSGGLPRRECRGQAVRDHQLIYVSVAPSAHWCEVENGCGFLIMGVPALGFFHKLHEFNMSVW